MNIRHTITCLLTLMAVSPFVARADTAGDPRGACTPACSKENVECFIGMAEYESRRPVGLLRVLDTNCTAWIIAAPNLLITNAHCYPGFVFGMSVEFNRECDACAGGTLKAIDTYEVTDFLHVNPALDYALFRVAGDPASTWGVAPVDDALPDVGQGVYEIHHGAGLPKGIDQGMVTSINVPGTCILGTQIEIGVTTIATGGASGSPIYSADTHCVVGICHCGPPCAPGNSVPMAAILADALPHIHAAGATVVPCGAGCASADGDINGDGMTNGFDIQAFSDAALMMPTSEQLCHGDFNNDGLLNSADIPGMVTALLGM